MGDGFANPNTTGDGTLILGSIHSPDYEAGSEGWSINRDGSAEFNDVVVRGKIEDGQLFIYNDTPAKGSLAYSISPNDGIDEYGNIYYSGINIYSTVSFANAMSLYARHSDGSLTLGGFISYDAVHNALDISSPNGGNVIRINNSGITMQFLDTSNNSTFLGLTDTLLTLSNSTAANVYASRIDLNRNNLLIYSIGQVVISGSGTGNSGSSMQVSSDGSVGLTVSSGVINPHIWANHPAIGTNLNVALYNNDVNNGQPFIQPFRKSVTFNSGGDGYMPFDRAFPFQCDAVVGQILSSSTSDLTLYCGSYNAAGVSWQLNKSGGGGQSGTLTIEGIATGY